MIKKMQKSFMKLLFFFIVMVLLSGALLLYSTMQFVLFNYINQANEHLVKQISSTFELVIDQVADKAYKLGIYDSGLVDVLDDSGQGALYTRKLYETLNSIVIENQYLHSVYLYKEDGDMIYDSQTGGSFYIEDFYDKPAARAMQEKYFSKVEPRSVRRTKGTADLLYSIIVVLPEKTKTGDAVMLSMNVDMNKLYQDIMKRNLLDNTGQLYIFNQDNQILVSADQTDIGAYIDKAVNDQTINMNHASFWTIITNQRGMIQATGTSKELGWNFCLKVPFEINSTYMINKYAAFIFISVTIALCLLVIYLVMRHTTKPLDRFLHSYNENIVKRLLTESNFMRDKNNLDLEYVEKLFARECFLVMLVEAEDFSGELNKIISEAILQTGEEGGQVFIKPVTLYHGKTAIVCNYDKAQGPFVETLFLNECYRKLKNGCTRKIYIAVSMMKLSYGELLMAVKECEEILEYKLSLPKHIMTYDEFCGLKGEIIYPADFEKQLINNLLVANLEGSMFYLDKYISHLFDDHSIISDLNVKNYVYQLQTELLKHISSLPISIKTNNCLDLKGPLDRASIYESLSEFINTICSEITKKNGNNENVLVQSILDYIQEHLTDDDFNLNTISYQMNMNRNYLAKVIKESTSYSFNDYVNYKKIETAREKLKDMNLTIEQISSLAGFSYSHYFIKVFKSVEGITPGAYRKMLLHNNDAQSD